MIKAQLWLDRDGVVSGFTVKGHAGCGSFGNDIVCAAVSALTQTAVLGLERYLVQPPQVIVEPGLLQLHLPRKLDAGERNLAGVILGTMYLGLQATAAEYSKYIKIEEIRDDGGD